MVIISFVLKSFTRVIFLSAVCIDSRVSQVVGASAFDAVTSRFDPAGPVKSISLKLAFTALLLDGKQCREQAQKVCLKMHFTKFLNIRVVLGRWTKRVG